MVDGFRVPACSLWKESRARVGTGLEGFLEVGRGVSSMPGFVAT